MQKVILCACVLLSVVVAMTSARPADDDTTARLEQLLKRLLQEEDGAAAAAGAVEKRHVCDDKDCHTGQCGGGENPNDWDEEYYCFDCNGPKNDQTNGGQHCELPDPCGVKTGNSPCSGNEPVCKQSSYRVEGYYCRASKRSALDDLLDHLEHDADQAEYHQIRMMMARSSSPAEGLAKYVRSALE